MTNFVKSGFSTNSENSCCFFYLKKTFAVFDLKVVDVYYSLSLFIVVYSNGDSELTLTFFTKRSNFVS